jgi:hypothetical protein
MPFILEGRYTVYPHLKKSIAITVPFVHGTSNEMNFHLKGITSLYGADYPAAREFSVLRCGIQISQQS